MPRTKKLKKRVENVYAKRFNLEVTGIRFYNGGNYPSNPGDDDLIGTVYVGRRGVLGGKKKKEILTVNHVVLSRSKDDISHQLRVAFERKHGLEELNRFSQSYIDGYDFELDVIKNFADDHFPVLSIAEVITNFVKDEYKAI